MRQENGITWVFLRYPEGNMSGIWKHPTGAFEGQTPKFCHCAPQSGRPGNVSHVPGVRTVSGLHVVGDEYVPARAPWRPPRQARPLRLEKLVSSEGRTEPVDTSDDTVPVVTATGRRLLGVRFPCAGAATVRLHYRSPYSDGDPVETYVQRALVEQRHVGSSVDQLRWPGPRPGTRGDGRSIRCRRDAPRTPLADVRCTRPRTGAGRVRRRRG
jgi:hypothetical protein